VCGSFLLHPEEGNTFCPQCGVRVSPRQEFCHECDAPLKEEPLKVVKAVSGEGPLPAAESGQVAAPQGMPPWLIGSLAVAGIVIIFVLIMLFSRSAPPPAPPAPTAAPKAEAPAPPPTPAPAPAPAPAPPPPAAPAADLKEELQTVISTLREAQLKKDISEFMSVYSTTFPDYDQKRKGALESWQNFDFTNLVFTVDKIQALDPNNALAGVTWYMDIKNRNTQEFSSITQAYQVRFVKEMGKWRIRELKEVQ
jgi:uncharacterized Zn finger protein (UPF0148 family)